MEDGSSPAPGDQVVLNSLDAHPEIPVVVTSGIESLVKVWTPRERSDEVCGAAALR
jgi:hypothetical protein